MILISEKHHCNLKENTFNLLFQTKKVKREIVRTRKSEAAIWILLFFFFVMGGILAVISQKP